MSDIIFKTDGKETFRMPSRTIQELTIGTKCPETKLEIKMTETDISRVLIEGDYATIMGIRYKRMEDPKSPVEEAYKDWCGEYPSGSPSEDARWDAFLNGYWVTQPKAVPVEEPSKPMNEVMDRLIKKYQAQKLWNRVRDELGYSIDCCDEIVDLVQNWLPEYQSAAGSQNVDTELLVDGFNHCLDKMKEMLR
jgi:hypothetical protein